MRHDSLGNSDLSVSKIGIGTSQFRYYDEVENSKFIEKAMDFGINYIDTARSYEKGEASIGMLSNAKKQKLHIATKTGYRGGKGCLLDLHNSLRTIGMSSVSIWMTHMLQTKKEYEFCTDLGGFCDIAEAAKSAGLVKQTGASFHAPTEVILRAIEEKAFDVVMFPINLMGRETVFGSSIEDYVTKLLPAAKKNGVSVVTMKVFSGGEMAYGAPKLVEILSEYGFSNEYEAALAFTISNPLINLSVLGSMNIAQLEESVKIAEIYQRVDQEFSMKIFNQVRAVTRSPCTRCGECVDVCPNGIRIPNIMRMLEQNQVFGMEKFSKIKYQQEKVAASNCSKCMLCEGQCPENFSISDQLNIAHNLLST